MMIRRPLLLFLFFAFLAGCGDESRSLSEGLPIIPSGSINGNVEQTVPQDGAVLEFMSFIKLSFPKDSFQIPIHAALSRNFDMDEINNYTETAFLFDSGPAADWIFHVDLSGIPQTSPVIDIDVPLNLIEQIGDGYVPRLFMQIAQQGSDNEIIVDFEPINSTFNPDTLHLSAVIPAYAFSSLIASQDYHYAANFIIGSSPKERYAPSHELTILTENILKSVSGQNDIDDSVCNGVALGSPLNVELIVTDGFQRGSHWGTDFRAADDEDVLAAADGTIEKIGWNLKPQPNRFGGISKGWGRYVVLKHIDGSKTLYAHLETESSSHLAVGQGVRKGDVIGKADTTGGATGPHLHMEYSPTGQLFASNDSKVNPVPCINGVFEGQITVSDNGILADDSFSITLDGALLGSTGIGASQSFGLGNLKQGRHELVVTADIAPDNVGTIGITLGQHALFEDGTTSKSGTLRQGQSASFVIIIE